MQWSQKKLYQHNELVMGWEQVAERGASFRNYLSCQQTTQGTLASGNMEFHWIYTILEGLRGFFPQNGKNFLKDKDDLQVKKVATIFLKKF